MAVFIENKPFVVGEFGREIRIGTDIDLVGRDLEIQFLPPVQNNEIITKTSNDGITLGTTDYIDPDTGLKLYANKYIYWKNDDMFNKSGDWKIRIRVINTSVGNESRLISIWEDFKVEP